MSISPLKTVNVAKAQEALGFAKPDPVYALIRSGQLPAFNASPQNKQRPVLRILLSDLEQFIIKNRVVEGAEPGSLTNGTHTNGNGAKNRTKRKARKLDVPTRDYFAEAK